MTRDEMNRKISELRGWRVVKMTSCWTLETPQFDNLPGQIIVASTEAMIWARIDWHADWMWPTLLRELPDVTLQKTKCGIVEAGYCWRLEGLANIGHFPDPADAVCEKWIRWRESQL